ncbi:AAA family ATPase [Clostridiaceae bacterium]|nr:AAA family ATPase [Clostridiaceae bacterium]
MNYLNTNRPGILFEEALNSKIYVDKSLLIEKVSDYIKTGDKYICITRPRRFGKTINANMLAAYYTKGLDSRRLFDNLLVAQCSSCKKYMNQHNVIHIDLSEMPDICESYQDYIRRIRKNIYRDLYDAFPEIVKDGYDSLNDLLLATNSSFIFILDEWDSIFYRDFMTDGDKNEYLRFLKNLLKDQPYVELAYMTGVLPIAKYSSGSELNMFREYNFMNDHKFEIFFGLTGEEVRKLCASHQDVSYEELKYWYDGYRTGSGRSLFNPRSVNFALSDGICLNYWTETGPMNEIADCIEHNVDEVREDIVKMVAGIPVETELGGYSAAELRLDTRDEILSAMVVYGFLSYYDGKLTIPNHELMEKYQKVLSRDSMGEVKEIVGRSKEMLEATLACNSERVAQLLEQAHDTEIPFLMYNDENSLSCVITLCYLYARKFYNILREEKSGKGYCDYLFLPKESGYPPIILELKAGKSPGEAIEQIKAKNYLQRAEPYGKALLVGISYGKEKRHQCKIEKYSFPDK